jgi:PTS system N-acetylgalactosamine-specific IIA component
MTAAAPRVVVAGHGQFAEGLRTAVAQITGREDAVVAVTNAGAAPEEIERRLETALTDAGLPLVFTDLPAGSCTTAARRLQRRQPGLVVVVGANLAAVLEFLMGDATDPVAAATRAADRGRGALTTVLPPAT